MRRDGTIDASTPQTRGLTGAHGIAASPIMGCRRFRPATTTRIRSFRLPDTSAIRVENIHDVRIIPLDGRPRLDDGIRQWNGDSRGHWEGDTLVVETTNYTDATEHRFPSSRNTRAVERFTRVSDDLIDYEFTIEDPTVYTKPWTAVRPMPKLTDYVIYEYACHEGNYAMANILAGERAKEKVAGGVATAGVR